MKDIEKRVRFGARLVGLEGQLGAMVDDLDSIKMQIENMKNKIDTDADFAANDKAVIQIAYDLVNNANYTNFITWLRKQLP